jgi:hypothetical protein
MPSVKVGQVYIVRNVDAAEADWRRLLVVGAVPAPDGAASTVFAVQQAQEPLETRGILGSTLLNDCDMEVVAS